MLPPRLRQGLSAARPRPADRGHPSHAPDAIVWWSEWETADLDVDGQQREVRDARRATRCCGNAWSRRPRACTGPGVPIVLLTHPPLLPSPLFPMRVASADAKHRHLNRLYREFAARHPGDVESSTSRCSYDVAGRYLLVAHADPRHVPAAQALLDRRAAARGPQRRRRPRRHQRRARQASRACAWSSSTCAEAAAAWCCPDQVPGLGEGEWAEFFGRPAYTMTLVGRLQEASGAALVFCFAERLPRGGGFEPCISLPHEDALPADRPAAARRVNERVETLVRTCPMQYLWGYNRYKRPAGRAAAARPRASGLSDAHPAARRGGLHRRANSWPRSPRAATRWSRACATAGRAAARRAQARRRST